ncbi:HEAT repeat domain-containing protein [Roseofilum reptotaenium CS-1145]|nr:HEAT repeat domain-containing protein [Roseofilum reptotaenium CS-1145]
MIGEPGSGKTTRLQKIADWILEQNLGLPIWISFKELTQPTLDHQIEEIWLKQTGESLTVEALRQHEGQIWVLLDGWDEITSTVDTSHVSQLLGGWVGQTRVVVTCRVNVGEADKNAFSGFDVFRNLELDSEQVNQYIGNWFAQIGYATRGEQLQEELQRSDNSRLLELIRNPLRLWMLCHIWQPEQGLPETQAELYAQFVEWVYSWKADEESLEQRQEIDRALAALALAAMEQSDDSSRFQLRESWILEVLPSRSLLESIKQLGWLNCLQRGTDTIYGFYHATFQEYFAALGVEDGDYFLPQYLVPGKEYRIFTPQWKQVILLWLGRGDVEEEKKEAFIGQLVHFEDGCGEWNFEQADRGFYSYRAYFLAAAGISEFKGCSRADEIVRQLVKWGFGDFNDEQEKWRTFLQPIQEGARNTLPETDRKRAIETLSYLLNHCQCPEGTCRRAAESLGHIDAGNSQAIAAVIQLLERTKDEDARRQLVGNLGQIGQGNAQAIATLVQLLEQTEDQFTQYEAADRLEQIGQGNAQAIAALVQLLEQTEDKSTYRRAAYRLGKIDPGNAQAIAALVQLLEQIEDEFSRCSVAYRLGKIDPRNQQAIATLVQVLTDTEDDNLDEYLCQIAACSLGQIDPGNQQAIAALVRLLEQTDDEHICLLAAEGLGQIDPGNQEAIAALVRLIKQAEDEDMLKWAAYTLWEIAPANQERIAALVQVLEQTKDINIRWEAVDSLSLERGNPQAIAALVQVLEQNEDETLHWTAVDSLGQIGQGNPQAIAALVKVLEQTEDEDIRSCAVHRLGQIGHGNPQEIAALVKVLEQTEDELTRWWAAKSLGKIDPGNQQAISVLVQLLVQTDTRYWMAESLGEIITTEEQQKSVVSALQPHLNPETYENNFRLFYNSYKVLWKIAQTLSYPDFYETWHGSLSENLLPGTSAPD